MTTLSPALVYQAQCANGRHIMEVLPDTELASRCEARAARDFLDALTLTAEECPGCVSELRDQAEQMQWLVAEFGCPEHFGEPWDGGCREDCPSRQTFVIADSVYQDQIRAWAHFMIA